MIYVTNLVYGKMGKGNPLLYCIAFLIVFFIFLSCGEEKRVKEYAGLPPNDRITNPAETIIEALEKYYNEQSHYPDDLDVLVPKYCKSIPCPEYGNRKWDYENDGSEYVLSVRLDDGNYVGYYYFSTDKKWEYDE